MRVLRIILVLIFGLIIPFATSAKDKTLEMVILGENDTYSGANDGEDNIIVSVWNMILAKSQKPKAKSQKPKAKSQTQLIIDYQQVSMSRSWSELIRLDNACVMNKLITADRLAIAEYSHYPLSVFPPVRLITLASNKSRFTSPFSFQQLENNPDLKLGVVKSRTYGVELDNQIVKHAAQVFTRGGVDSSDKLVDMLLVGRVDGILEYTLSVEDYLQDEGLDDKIIALPIENNAALMIGYMACSKTTKGLAIIDVIDSSYATSGFSQQYIEMHLNHFGQVEAEILKPKLESLFAN
ncbi:hypothetical protein Sps_04060 [Shewanella psychrophila]|uniref:Solute-binding protein family 3/N-terminal domain-containing protein n=1 Tax=Shewanella psychrophila TaxID=225848 RepID=A0A1S6HUF0_9GAMM|nr:hypothetical protein [Shewanella psychrophila]AQS39175.1 hypothetical protein Sps_04060 [Shewanella psychrophila]